MRIAETEAIKKITFEVQHLFKVVDEVSIENELSEGIVTTTLRIGDKTYKESGTIKPTELERVEINRLVKRNLYKIFTRELDKEAVPYGIMSGVRPTKIIHRWQREQGQSQTTIIKRLMEEYLVSEEKAKLLTEVAERQKAILNQTEERTISIYIGIPFCTSRCLYCSFPSNVLPNEKKLEEFMGVLERDIEAAKIEIEKYNFKIQNIYIGGGTPTSLPEKYFERLLKKVEKAFNSKEVEEYTVECGRPDTISIEKIEAMRAHKVTRVSVNPQTMQQKTLELIGRRHTPEEIVKAYKELRVRGTWQINMDLILGLPGERVEDVVDSVNKVIELRPDDITVHALALKRGSRLQMQVDDEEKRLEDYNLPSDEEVREMAKVTEEKIRGAGYEPYYLYRQGYMSGQIENIGYSRDGAIGIYNVQIMDERQTIIGIGGAATTKVVDKRNKCLKSSFNAKDLITYLRDINKYIEKRAKLLEEIYGR